MTIEQFKLQIIFINASYRIEVYPHTTILDIKKSLESFIHVPVHLQKISLNFNRQELLDDMRAGDLELESKGKLLFRFKNIRIFD